MLKTPSNWSEKIIMIIPATILNVCEFSKRIFPKKEAAAPKIIKTKENPKENKIKGTKLIFFFKINSFNEAPEINETYPGINGKTQGDKKLISPAPNAIINSIINLNYIITGPYKQLLGVFVRPNHQS